MIIFPPKVSQALIWMFWLIGKSHEKQAKLYEEISSNIGSSPVTAANLGYLPYLKACVKESFRFRTLTLIVHLIFLNEVEYALQMNEIKKILFIDVFHQWLLVQQEFFNLIRK